MGIERFYTESIAVYSGVVTAGSDPVWTAISGSPFVASVTELSGSKAIVGGAVEKRADKRFYTDNNTAITASCRIKHDGETYEIIQIQRFPEYPGHHMEIYGSRVEGNPL